MKHEVVEHIAKCLTFQQFKEDHQNPYGLLQPLPYLEWKWEQITMYFVVGLSQSQQIHNAT